MLPPFLFLSLSLSIQPHDLFTSCYQLTQLVNSAAVGGIFRTYYIHTLDNNLDATYDFAPFMIWGGTELWCIIILGSVPPLRPLFVKFFAGSRLTSLSSHPSRSGNSGAGGIGNTNSRSLYGPGSARITTDSKRSQLRSVEEGVGVGAENRTKLAWMSRNRSVDKLGSGSVMDCEDDERGLIMPMPKDGIVVQSTFEMVETKRADGGKDRDVRSVRAKTSEVDLV